MNNFISNFRNSPIAQKLIAQNTFTVADTATGHFHPDSPNDHWRLDRNAQWCRLYCKNKFRRQLRMAQGVVVFEFEDAADAAAFRRVTARVPSLIACR
jgi:hypothetical protein